MPAVAVAEGCVEIVNLFAAAGLIVNELLVAEVRLPLVAVSVLLPALVTLKVLNVAEPLAPVFTLVVPPNVPPPFNVNEMLVPL